MMKTVQQSQRLDPNAQSSASSTQQLFVDLSTDLLRRGQSIRFRAPGRSMQPTIRDGEVITVEPVSLADVKRGDIILYRSHMGVTAHRVTRIQKKDGTADLMILRGDAPGSPDELVLPRQVLGKVVWVERGGRLIAPWSWRAMIYRTLRFSVSRLKRWTRLKAAYLITCFSH
jgi:phage repressor protein C with HTH and peptisase S24 domain